MRAMAIHGRSIRVLRQQHVDRWQTVAAVHRHARPIVDDRDRAVGRDLDVAGSIHGHGASTRSPALAGLATGLVIPAWPRPAAGESGRSTRRELPMRYVSLHIL
jgi:hypothetical protein